MLAAAERVGGGLQGCNKGLNSRGVDGDIAGERRRLGNLESGRGKEATGEVQRIDDGGVGGEDGGKGGGAGLGGLEIVEEAGEAANLEAQEIAGEGDKSRRSDGKQGLKIGRGLRKIL